jgi:membrane protease YdiL (CAAX protease family)
VVRPRIITWRDMGLRRSALKPSWQAGLLAAPALFLLAAAIELALQALGVRQTQLDGLGWIRSIPLWQYLLISFAAAVLAPIAEEIYFRGYVFRAYLDQKGPVQAYVFSSLLFALVHLNLPALLPIFVVGLFLAFLYHRTGSVFPGIVAHAFNNAVAFVVLYFAL